MAAFNATGWLASLNLPDLPYSVSRAYLLLRSSLWAAWGVVTATLALLGRPRALSWLRVGGMVLLGWYWADRLWLAQSEYARSRWPLAALLTALAVGGVAVILNRPAVRQYFKEDRP